jgi:hypothetical protein
VTISFVHQAIAGGYFRSGFAFAWDLLVYSLEAMFTLLSCISLAIASCIKTIDVLCMRGTKLGDLKHFPQCCELSSNNSVQLSLAENCVDLCGLGLYCCGKRFRPLPGPTLLPRKLMLSLGSGCPVSHVWGKNDHLCKRCFSILLYWSKDIKDVGCDVQYEVTLLSLLA